MVRAAGHDALSVTEQGLTGADDEDLWPRVQSESRVLFTADKGFGDIRTFAPGTHAGVILFRHPRESRAAYIQLVEALLAEFRLEDAAGATVIVSPGSIRINRGN